MRLMKAGVGLQVDAEREKVLNRILSNARMGATRPAPGRSRYCMMSYSHKDHRFVEKLVFDLNDCGVPCWYDQRDLLPGQKIADEAFRAVDSCRKVILVLSGSSLRSQWVDTEVRRAAAREKRENRAIIVAIRLVRLERLRSWRCMDGKTGEDIAESIRQRFIPDFSGWRNDSYAYHESFGRLLEAAKCRR